MAGYSLLAPLTGQSGVRLPNSIYLLQARLCFCFDLYFRGGRGCLALRNLAIFGVEGPCASELYVFAGWSGPCPLEPYLSRGTGSLALRNPLHFCGLEGPCPFEPGCNVILSPRHVPQFKMIWILGTCRTKFRPRSKIFHENRAFTRRDLSRGQSLRDMTLQHVPSCVPTFKFLWCRGGLALWNVTLFGVEGALRFGTLRFLRGRGGIALWKFTFLWGRGGIALWNVRFLRGRGGILVLWNLTFLRGRGVSPFGTLPFCGLRGHCTLERYVVAG